MSIQLTLRQREILEALAAGAIIEQSKSGRVKVKPARAVQGKVYSRTVIYLYIKGALIRRADGRYTIARYGEYLLDYNAHWRRPALTA